MGSAVELVHQRSGFESCLCTLHARFINLLEEERNFFLKDGIIYIHSCKA